MSNRHLARTIAMQTLFSWDFNGKQEENLNNLIEQNFKQFAPKFDDHGFVKSIINGVIKNEDEIDKYIIKYATEWPLDQITIVDRNILADQPIMNDFRHFGDKMTKIQHRQVDKAYEDLSKIFSKHYENAMIH